MTDEIRDSFMSMFKMIDPNKKYMPAKIAVFYHVIGEDMIKSPILNNMMDIDMRFSFGLCIKSGHGKLPIKMVVKESANAIRRRYSEFTSLHEEQLIGKRWFDKDRGETRETRGYFYDNFLVKDDGLPFINASKFEIARNYMLTALDVYGKNLIVKKLVEDDVGLRYYGRCSFLYFIQPSEKIVEKNVSSGLFRRAPILKIDLTDEEERTIIGERMSMKHKSKSKDWIEFLSNIRNISFNYIEIKENIIKMINKEVIKLISNDNMLSTMNIVNQNNILKWSYINALLRMSKVNSYKTYKTEDKEILDLEVIEEDVQKAVADYRIVYSSIKKFVEENRYGNLHEYEQVIVDILVENGAFDEKTAVDSKRLQEILVIRTKQKIPTLKKHYYNLRTNKTISTKRGQYNSKVWLS